MPKITKVFQLDVTPEKFLEACTVDELKETVLLLNSKRYQHKLNTSSGELTETPIQELVQAAKLKIHKDKL